MDEFTTKKIRRCCVYLMLYKVIIIVWWHHCMTTSLYDEPSVFNMICWFIPHLLRMLVAANFLKWEWCISIVMKIQGWEVTRLVAVMASWVDGNDCWRAWRCWGDTRYLGVLIRVWAWRRSRRVVSGKISMTTREDGGWSTKITQPVLMQKLKDEVVCVLY